MSLLVLGAAWLAFGAAAVALMHHRGHDAFAWTVVFLLLGPLAIPLAVSADRHPPTEANRSFHDGPLDLLVAHDGSPSADAALDAALAFVGSGISSLTLAAVIDLDAPSSVRGREAGREASDRLEALASAIAASTDAAVDTVVLFGRPATALRRHAVECGYELIVASSPVVGRGAARELATRSRVPVFGGLGARDER